MHEPVTLSLQNDACDRGAVGLREATRLETEFMDKMRPMYNKVITL